jgi:hypothetical protein
MRDTEVHSAFVRWLTSIAAGVKVIKAYGDGARPALPYLMVNQTTIAEVRAHAQRDAYDAEDTAGEIVARPLIETEWTMSVHALGVAPTELLRPVRAAAMLAQKNEPLMPGLHVQDVSAIRFVPEYVNERWEPRAQMDVFLRGMVDDGFVIDVIETYAFEFERS